MLTSEEKEILDALREHMDDEQKEAFDEMSDEEKKEFVKEAKKEMAKQMGGQGAEPKGCLGKIRDLRDCPWGEVWRDGGRWVGKGDARLQMSLVKLLLKLLFFWL